MRRFLFSSLALSVCAFRNYAVYAHRGNLVPLVFMLSVKALAESDGHPPVLEGPSDPCEEYAHFGQTIHCKENYGPGRGTNWKDEMKACFDCVAWRLAKVEDDLIDQHNYFNLLTMRFLRDRCYLDVRRSVQIHLYLDLNSVLHRPRGATRTRKQRTSGTRKSTART